MTVKFGENIKVEIYGASHAECIGVRIEGLPEGLTIDRVELQSFLERRAPGRNAWSTPRKEADRPAFISGVKSSESEKTADEADLLITTGACLEAVIYNTNTRPKDYKNSSVVPRPGHADYPAWVKYGKIESGGGQFSARLTAALCIAGGICMQWLKAKDISIAGHIFSIGGIKDEALDMKSANIAKQINYEGQFPVVSQEQGEKMKALIAETRSNCDSIGGEIECIVSGMPVGIGSPIFGSIESRICQTLFAVPAVKGVEFGAGFAVAEMTGSQNNDPYRMKDGRIVTETNNHGGILGGLSSGMPIIFRTAMKPTPSIAMEQDSVDLETMENARLAVKGRHDPCIVPRAVPCIEAAAALAIYDMLMDA